MAEMKYSGAATAKLSMATAAFVLLLSWETVQGRALTSASVDKKVSVTVKTNMTVNVHAQIPGSDSSFTTTVYPGTTTLKIPFPPGTNLTTLVFPVQISVEPVQFLGFPVTGPASSTILIAPNTMVEIQGYLTQIINAVLGLVTVYYKMLISAVPSGLPGVPPVTVPIPGISGISGAPVPTKAIGPHFG